MIRNWSEHSMKKSCEFSNPRNYGKKSLCFPHHKSYSICFQREGPKGPVPQPPLLHRPDPLQGCQVTDLLWWTRFSPCAQLCPLLLKPSAPAHVELAGTPMLWASTLARTQAQVSFSLLLNHYNTHVLQNMWIKGHLLGKVDMTSTPPSQKSLMVCFPKLR